MPNSRDLILGSIRASLERSVSSPVAPRPAILPARNPGTVDQEIEKLLAEATAIKADARRIQPADIPAALRDLVKTQAIGKAVLWNTARLKQLGVADALRALGVTIIPHDADKNVMATADLGITEADFALPETGTIGLYSSADQPRSVSLLPRVHLAFVPRRALRADLHQVFAEAKARGYLVLITGPSRTSDIELILTIGVHGPQVYYLWVIDD